MQYLTFSTITNLSVITTPQDYEYTFELVCTQCDTHAKEIPINLNESHEFGRASVSYVAKCSFCGNTGTIQIKLPKNYAGYVIKREEGEEEGEEAKNGGKQKMLEIDGRGWKAVDFLPVGLFKGFIKGKEVEVEFDDGEWYDYDDNIGELSAIEAEWKIE
ncbi:hypothetical protein DAMA08_016290 [Martiniozyma asiatica (nom. inval.)]|nr:hypothetical protein DAMA08_016290 [Martiniozyma asiatica]